jgi:threonine aldolase
MGSSKNIQSHWGSPRQTGAAFDFRSDVITTPSRGMLAAISRATLRDDVFGEDATTADFEQFMAQICGHESAVLVLTGTMANQLALRSLLHQPPHAILAATDAHIVQLEAGGLAHLSGAMIQAVTPSNGLYLRLDDIRKHAVVDDGDVHKCPTRIISLENTASGTIMPLADVRAIRAWAAPRRIAVHMDGARLWEAVSAGAGTLREYASTVDFSKNLGAPLGAMVLGSAELTGRLRRLRKSIGGGWRQAGIVAAAARHAVEENFGPGIGIADGRDVFGQSRRLANVVGDMWVRRGGKLLRPVQTNMAWLDLSACGVSAEEWIELGRRHGIKLGGERLVLHHQIDQLAVDRLGEVMDEVLRRPRSSCRARL